MKKQWENPDFKVKSIPLTKRTRDEQLAAALYPQQSPYKDEALKILKAEGWNTDTKGLLSDTSRSFVSPLGGQIQTPKGRFTIQRTR
jgi:hypothetical protein